MDARQVRIVILQHRDPMLQLVIQHDQRAVDAFGDVHLLARGLVHERVLFDGLHQL